MVSLLPFVRDILDIVGLAPMQLYPNFWRILISCYVVWRRVLRDMDEEYPDLTAREFFHTNQIQHREDNVCNFRSCLRFRVAHLEPQYNCV